MTKQTYTENLQHNDDPTFRAWATNLSNALQAAGLTKTADTGQITIGSATRPGVGTAAGYEIYRFSDALQSTKPIFLKIEYGTHSTAATIPNIWITAGTGSNGAGTITGIFYNRTVMNGTNTSPNVGNSGKTWVVHNTVTGTLVLVWGSNVGGAVWAHLTLFVLDRTKDTAGAPTAEGLAVITAHNSTVNSPAGANVNFTAGVAFTNFTNYANCLVPVQAGAIGTAIQVYRHFTAAGRVSGLLGVFSYNSVDISSGTILQTTLMGATARTYLCLGTLGWTGWTTLKDVNYCLAVLWDDI